MVNNDESGAYDLFMSVVLFAVSVVTFAAMNYVSNLITAPMNLDLATGMLSESSQSVTNFIVACISYGSLATLVGIFLYNINAANSKRQGLGSMFQSLAGGWIIMVCCFLTALVLALVTHEMLDVALLPSANLMANATHLSQQWQDIQSGTSSFFINMVYFLLYSIPALGIVIYLQSALKKTGGGYYTGGY
jgi:hypothetical protein